MFCPAQAAIPRARTLDLDMKYVSFSATLFFGVSLFVKRTLFKHALFEAQACEFLKPWSARHGAVRSECSS
jgi:hypothetical protein